MLAETGGWSTDAPTLSSSTSICHSSSRNRFRFLGSRTSSGDGGSEGAAPRKNVSAWPSPARRGCGAIMSIQVAFPSTSAPRSNPSLFASYSRARTISSRRFRWCTLASSSPWLSVGSPDPSSQHHPTTVDVEVDTVDRRILEQEHRRIYDLLRQNIASGRRAGSYVRQHLVLAAPEWSIGNDAGMDRVDPNWSELDRQRPDQRRDGAVDGRNRRRARVGPILRQSPEQENGRVGSEPVCELMDDLRIADQLQADQSRRLVDVVLGDRVLVSLHRDQREPVGALHTAKGVGDRARLREVDADSAGLASQAGGDSGRSSFVPSTNRDACSSSMVGRGELVAETRGTPDHVDVSGQVRLPV